MALRSLDRVNSLARVDNEAEVDQKSRGFPGLLSVFSAVRIQRMLAWGCWGMMFYYFGDPGNTKNPALWAEIQWTGWLYDGGIALVFFYTLCHRKLAFRVCI